MPKKRRFTQIKQRGKASYNRDSSDVKEVTAARGRLKGALMDVLEPAGEESDSASEHTPAQKGESSHEQDSDEDDNRAPHRQSYVLKLFDRSVDLSQFSETSPLYPICRAWIYNQPKANYKKFGKKMKQPEPTSDSLELPGPEGPVVSKIPSLLPEQLKADKNNINLDYQEAPPPSKDELLAWHSDRWLAVRQAWLEQAARAEERYDATQQVLNKINVNAL